MVQKSWSDKTLKDAVKVSLSISQVLHKLNLVPAGGNYDAVKRRIIELEIDISHFTGKAWRKGSKEPVIKARDLSTILRQHSHVQSYKLKHRLFRTGLKQAKCEECGWAKKSIDGRIPVELDHINGIKSDNRIENLRILCPNCHSLKETHRGKNKKARVVKWYTRNT